MNRFLQKIFLLFTLLLFISCFSFGQKLTIKNYSIDDGLPQLQILDEYQDYTGAMWFATNGSGISRFDGLKFDNYTTKRGLKSNHVFCFYEDNNKELWIATAKGLNKFVSI